MKNSKIWLGAALLTAMPFTSNAVFAAPLKPTLVSKSEGFSVWLPSKAQVMQKPQPLPNGGLGTVKYYAVPSKPVGFVVIPMTLPGVLPAGQTKQFLDGVQRGFTGAAGAKLISSKSLSLNGASGREMVVTAGETRIQGRFFVLGKRSYQVLAVSSQKSAAAQAPLIAKVLNSFRLLR
ncbi:hypothetical protein EON80_03420 [bacterium]|nr:MAG: hypothetical protein EON80_03420 [bacterium]